MTTWLVDGLIPEGDSVLFVGEPNKVKLLRIKNKGLLNVKN